MTGLPGPRHVLRSLVLPAFASLALVAAALASCRSEPGLLFQGTASGTLGGGSSTSTPDTAPATIRMADQRFVPQVDTVGVGATVIWTNDDGIDHTVTADDGSFDSGTIPADGTFADTFTAAGAFPYHDRTYGAPGSGMHGTIVVR